MRQTQHTLHQPSLCVEKYTLTIENDSIFDESPTESLKTSIWRQSRLNKTKMYTFMALLIDKKPRKAIAKNNELTIEQWKILLWNKQIISM